MLAVIETHPIQYHAPVYRMVQQSYGIPVTVVYGSDFSVRGYRDDEFGTSFSWDTDLLSGYTPVFLSQVASGGPDTADRVSTRGLAQVLRNLKPAAVLTVGYSPRFHRDAWLAAWRAGSTILFRGETNDNARQRSWWKQVGRDAALRAAYSTCTRLLYVGRRSRAHFERLGVSSDRLVFSPVLCRRVALRDERGRSGRDASAGSQSTGLGRRRPGSALFRQIELAKRR